jgi:hypothetical protein
MKHIHFNQSEQGFTAFLRSRLEERCASLTLTAAVFTLLQTAAFLIFFLNLINQTTFCFFIEILGKRRQKNNFYIKIMIKLRSKGLTGIRLELAYIVLYTYFDMSRI